MNARDGSGDGPPASSEPPARARANKEWGARFAHLLATMPHSHQLGVCAELRIPWHTHKRWMAAEAEEGSDLAEYQAEVIAALAKQRAADLDDIETAVETTDGSKAATVWNMRKHRHESRFKRFYEEPPSKVEHSGPDGKPLQVTAGPITPEAAELMAKRMLFGEK